MQNVQNLLWFIDKSTFFKNEEKWVKVFPGLAKYIAVDPKEAFIDIY